MTKCINQILDASINDDELLKLGEIRFLMGDSVSILNVDSSNNFHIKILDDNTFGPDFGGGKEYENVNIMISAQGLAIPKSTKLSLINKYNIKHIRFNSSADYNCEINANDFEYCKNLEKFTFMAGGSSDNSKINGNVSKIIYNGKLTDLVLYACYLTEQPTFEQLFHSKNETVEKIDVTNLINGVHHVENELQYFGNLIACTEFKWWNDELNGSIESFVAKNRENGRTSGTVQIQAHNATQITFNGNVITGVAYGTFEDLVWTPTTITFEGTTITA